MKPGKIAFFITFLTTMIACGQTNEPLDLAKKIFGKEAVPNMHEYIAGEYKGQPSGQDLQSGSKTRFLLLSQTSNKAVVAMTILDSTGKGLDTYLHFQKDSTWKMNAFRALAMTGMIEQAKNELELMTSKQVDELIEKSNKSKNKADIIFATRDDYNFELGNAKLILQLDDSITRHFLQHKPEFERIKDAALKELANKKQPGDGYVKLVEKLRNEYRKLFIFSVTFGDYELEGKALNFLIGGMVDNTVGFLYVHDKKDLPEINDTRVIMTREIGDGWYLYKTT